MSTNPAVTQLNSLYQYLDRLYPQAATLAASGRLQLACEQIAPKFCQLYQQQPALMQAQLALSSGSHSAMANLALKQAVIILSMAADGRWPLLLQEQLLSASFAGLSGLRSEMFQPNSGETAQLTDPWLITVRSQQQHLPAHWLQLFASCCRLQQQAPMWQQDPLATILLLAYRLALPLVQPSTAGKVGFETVFRQLWRQTDGFSLTLLQRLANQGANLHQLGRFCSDSIGAVAFITATEPQLQGYLFDLSLKSLSADPVELTGSGMQLLGPRVCRDQSWLALLVRHAKDLLETADPEPMSLALIQQLNPQWSVSRQVSFLSAHPTFCRLLRDAAADLSRQRTPITDLRHALALIGTEQLPMLLRQAWLAQQTALCTQPWQQWFRQLELQFAQALQLLASQTQRVVLTANDAKLIAGCFNLQLQQHEELRHQPLYRSGKVNQSLAHQCNQIIWHDQEFPRQVAQVLAATGLNVLWQDAALQLRTTSQIQADYTQQQTAQLLLKFAWVLTELSFFGEASQPEQLETLYKNSRHALDLPTVPLSNTLEQLLQHHAAFWPLQPAM